MAETNGAVAPNDGGTPEAVLSDAAIDGAIEHAEQNPVDVAKLKSEQEAVELRARIRAQEERINDLLRTSNQQSEMLSELVGRSRNAAEYGWAREVERVRATMRRAVADADQPTYDTAERELLGLMNTGPASPTKQDQKTDDKGTGKTGQAAAPPDPAVAAWLNDNPWFHSDKKLHRAAVAAEASIMEEKPYLTTAERLKEVRAEMVQQFPKKFENEARHQPPAVIRPGPQASKLKSKAKTEADLPAGARAAMERFVKQGVLTKDQYLKD
jgi:hypothetical protein